MSIKKLMLIDGHSILLRGFYGVPIQKNSNGIHVNAVIGFFNMFLRFLAYEKPDHIMTAFDVSKKTLKRTAIFPEYKGTRKPLPAEAIEQIPIVQEILKLMNIPVLTLEGYEADDILGTTAKYRQREGVNSVVVSSDRDLLQLCDKHINVLMPHTSKEGTELLFFDSTAVREKYGINPIEIIDLKALMGDSADNIPGLPGVGEKYATDVIAKYSTIENAYLHSDEIKPKRIGDILTEHYDIALLSKELATIDIYAPVDFDPAILSENVGNISKIYTEEAIKKLKDLELENLALSFEQQKIFQERK